MVKETFHVISIIVKRSLVNGKDMLQQTLSVVSDAVQGQLDTVSGPTPHPTPPTHVILG